MMKIKKIAKSFHGRILLISTIGIMACILSCYLAFNVTIRTVGQHQMEDAMKSNMDKELEHLEFCYFTMVRMMQQLGEEGSIGTMLCHYLQADNNFDKYQRKRELENEIVSIGFINNYVNFSTYVDSRTKEELFGSESFECENFSAAGCVSRIGENQFQVLHRSNSKYNNNFVVSMLREGQRFENRILDVYIEMKSNIADYVQEAGELSYLSMQLDEDGRVLFSNSSLFAPGDVMQLSLNENGCFAGSYRAYYLVAKKSEMGFIYVNGVPQTVYRRELISWYEKIIFLCVLSVVPALLIMLTTKRMLGNPLKCLEQTIIEVGAGKLELVSEDMEVQEFRELMHQINEMKIHIRELLGKVQAEEQQRQKTEREKLMYQINPHFLLNTLNSVQWMAQLEHQDSISRFLADFKALLAYNLGKEEKISTLRTEVEIARKYISLQKQRYDFEVDLEVEEGAYLETETIRMLLQPLIENAIRYGLGETGRVEIRIFQDERRGFAVVTIQDHGNGLSREKLEELNRPFCYKGNGEEEGAGIGLRYVRHCLEGFYAGKSILTINSELGRGTKVTIILPVAGKTAG